MSAKPLKLVTDQDYLPTLLSLIERARKKIDVLSFSFAIGSAAGRHNAKSAPYEIALKLIEVKKKKKIKIRFYTEGLRETVGRNKVTADFLEEAGIEVRFGSTHAKGFCIDGQLVLFGSTNLTHQSITKNHEANLLMNDKSLAKEFTRYFEHLWKGGKHGGIKLQAPFLADGDFKEELIEMINTAKKSINFSIYFFNQRDIEKALVNAHKRGVKVTGFIHQHHAFALPYIRANRATVKRMQAAGITDLTFGNPKIFSHSKYLVKDQKEILMGTGNWLNEDVHVHPQLTVHLSSPAIAKSLIKHLTFQLSKLTQ